MFVFYSKIYSTDNPTLTERISQTTNNQNRITDRDLHANDEVQRNIQRIMQDMYQFFYERKNKQFRALHGLQRRRIVPNYKAAQAYLAIVRRKPSIARGYLGKIWTDHYEEIFGNACVEDLLATHLIHRHCAKMARTAHKDTSMPSISQQVMVYGAFHLARICGYLLADDKWGSKNSDATAEFIHALESDDTPLAIAYQKALDILVGIRNSTLEEHPNPTLYFKASEIQKTIERALADLNSAPSSET